MTMVQKIASGVTRTTVITALVAASLGFGGSQILSASAPQQTCHIAPGDSCLVIADLASPTPSLPPSAAPSPSVAPTPPATPAPTPSSTPTSTPLPTASAPVISGITVVPTSDGATISWNLNPAGTGQVQYGPTSAYGSVTQQEVNLLTFHRQTITGQAPGATIHFRILATNPSGATNSADQVVVVLGGGSSPTPTAIPTPTPTASPVAGACYGPCIGMDSLANTIVSGGQANYYRFKAGQSSPLKTARVYIIANGNTGYSNGNGGSYRPDLESCNASNQPSGVVLATASTLTTGNPGASMFTITFPAPFTTVSGTLYCLVWTDIGANPTTNYVSLDGIYDARAFIPQEPKYPDDSWGWGYQTGSGWTERNEQVPILDLGYGNGAHEGVGYMEISYGSDIGVVSGSNQLRELFTVSGGDRNVSSVGVFGWRTAGSGSMTVILANSITGNIASVSVSFPTGAPGSVGGSWASATFPPVTLVNGQTYTLTYSSSSTYQFTPIRKGSADYGYSPSTVFSDGTAQKSSGGVWSSSGRVSGENDLSWYLK